MPEIPFMIFHVYKHTTENMNLWMNFWNDELTPCYFEILVQVGLPDVSFFEYPSEIFF